MRRSTGRGCWRWDWEKEEGWGGDRRQWWPEVGGGAPWTVCARPDRCPGPSPSGHMARWGPGRQPSRPHSPLGAGRILPSLCWAGALGGWARQHPALPMPHPKPTHIPQFLPRPRPLPTRPGGSTGASPQWPGGLGGQAWPEGGMWMGAAVGTERGRSWEGASAGKRPAPPLAQAAATLAGWVGPAWA